MVQMGHLYINGIFWQGTMAVVEEEVTFSLYVEIHSRKVSMLTYTS